MGRKSFPIFLGDYWKQDRKLRKIQNVIAVTEQELRVNHPFSNNDQKCMDRGREAPGVWSDVTLDGRITILH